MSSSTVLTLVTISPVNSGLVADASGKIAMSCGMPASSLSNVSVVALSAGKLIVVVSNASPEAVTVVVVPPLVGGPPDEGGADVGGGSPLEGGPLGGGPPPPAPLPGVTVTEPLMSGWTSQWK